MNSIPKNELLQADLDPLTGITQCLDNQWAPSHIIQRAAHDRKPLSHYASEIEAATKTEFFKALLTLHSVVVNRAFLINNKTVNQLYLGNHENAEVFNQFLDDTTILPFLYNERDLTQFGVNPVSQEVAEYWSQAEQRKTKKLRLSWDDKRNEALINENIARRFGTFFSTLHDLKPELFRSHFSATVDEHDIKKAFSQIRDHANRVRDETGSRPRDRDFSGRRIEV